MKRQITLNSLKGELTENDITQILSIVGYRCRTKTVNRLRSILTYGQTSLGNYGIYDRLIFDENNGHWEYVAGQSYPDEIRTLRDCILGKIY